MIIQSVELVSAPDAPEFQEKLYRARCDDGAEVELFRHHWDVDLPPESLVGLTIDEARCRRKERMLDTARRYQMGHWRSA